jgi:quercetin dioxygenase-like cupin family protein
LGQKTESKPTILEVNRSKVPIEVLEKKGADKVKVQYLIDERHGSNRFALRIYTVEKGGHTPLDEHEYEHHVYVLNGTGLLRETRNNSLAVRRLNEGDALFVPSNAVHQFINERDEPFVFLCVKGNPKLYPPSDKSRVRMVAAKDSDDYC